MNFIKNITLFTLLLLSTLSKATNGACVNVESPFECGAGCWNNGTIIGNSTYLCEPVGVGYYSLANSNDRNKCPSGHVSSDPEADSCDPCPPGTFANIINQANCLSCLESSYSSSWGSPTCFSCNATLYFGVGSTGITEDGYCYKDSPAPSSSPSTSPSLEPSSAPSNLPTSAPSIAPSTEPSESPSSLPSTEPSTAPSVLPTTQPSSEPSVSPTAEPSSAPSLLPSGMPSLFPSEQPSLIVNLPFNVDNSVCGVDEYVFHGSCAQCPPTVRNIAFPIATVVIAGVIGLYYFFSAPQGTANVIILIGYMQGLALIGTTHTRWTSAMKWIFNIGGIFALDLDVIVPLECVLDVTPQQSKLPTLLVVFASFVMGMTGIKLWTKCRETHSSQPTKKLFGMTMIALVIGFQSLTRISLEAMQCSPVQYNADGETSKADWFCAKNGTTGDIIIACVGGAALLLYSFGSLVVLYVMLKHYKDSVHAERIPDAADASVVDPESQQGKAATLRQQATHSEANPMKDTLRPLLNTYTDDKWNWSFYLLLFKLINVSFVVGLGDIPMVGQVFMILLEVIAIAVTWKSSPYWQDSAGDVEGETSTVSSFSLWTHQANDIVLRIISVAVLVLGILLRYLDVTSDGYGFIGVIFLVVMSAGVVYNLAMAIVSLKEHFEKQREAMHDENTTVTSNVTRRKTEQVEESVGTKEAVRETEVGADTV